MTRRGQEIDNFLNAKWNVIIEKINQDRDILQDIKDRNVMVTFKEREVKEKIEKTLNLLEDIKEREATLKDKEDSLEISTKTLNEGFENLDKCRRSWIEEFERRYNELTTRENALLAKEPEKDNTYEIEKKKRKRVRKN
jgi:hypothetical protein